MEHSPKDFDHSHLPKVYDQFDAATRNIAVHVLIHNGEMAGRVVFKYGTAVTCYFHLYGFQMVRAMAGGGGYDRASAAVSTCAEKMLKRINKGEEDGAYPCGGLTISEVRHALDTLAKVDGTGWVKALVFALNEKMTVRQAC